MLTRRGTFHALDYPGHLNTIAQRLLADGTILGCYHDTDTMGTMHGMSFSRRGFEAIGEMMTMHNGATPDGQFIVGLFTDVDGRGKGYIVDRGRFSPLEVPGAASTVVWDVNPSKLIVGVFRTPPDSSMDSSTTVGPLVVSTHIWSQHGRRHGRRICRQRRADRWIPRTVGKSMTLDRDSLMEAPGGSRR